MMRSLYSAVSGLKTHQTRMDVIGNNISNVNTEAFKSTSVTFSDLMYQTTSSASAGNGATGTGGVNAKQIGLGVKTGATSVAITTAGAAETTGNAFDLKLTDSQSTNFFIVSDGTNTKFTRAGSFYVDGNGYLCMNSTGYTVMGWQLDDTTGDIKKDTVSALQVMSPANQTSDPEFTTQSYVKGILDKNDTNLDGDGYIMNLSLYDNLGYSYIAKFTITPVEDAANPGNYIEGQFDINFTDLLDSENQSVLTADQRNTVWGGAQRMTYDTNDGTFVSISNPTDAENPFSHNLDFTALLADFPQFSTPDPADPNNAAANINTITVDFSASKSENNGGTSTLAIKSGTANGDGKGKKVGALTALTVSSDGKIYGTYDNGNTDLLCQISVAQFSNASGLEKVGENCYMTTLNSGDFDGIGIEINADGSSISTGELEMSNVDLSSEFTSMIITQRGFQANSRVITTSDTLLEELINLKR